MEIGSVRHKALRRFFETGDAKGLEARVVGRLSRMLFFLASAASIDELKTPPNFGAHQLTGDRTGAWALTVSRNWRMTFRLDEAGAVVELDLEDYH